MPRWRQGPCGQRNLDGRGKLEVGSWKLEVETPASGDSLNLAIRMFRKALCIARMHRRGVGVGPIIEFSAPLPAPPL